MLYEAPATPQALLTTKSSAIVVVASSRVREAAPPTGLDDQVEEPMDYSPIADVVAPDYPPEEWPEGPGPLGF
jgi:hypothetical protein